MLQILLDPYFFSREATGDAKVANLAISISGISWQNGADLPARELLTQLIYPWQWQAVPRQFTLFWIDEAESIDDTTSVSFPSAEKSLDDKYEIDKDIYTTYNEDVLNNYLFLTDDNVNVVEKEIYWSYGTNTKKEINLSDDDQQNYGDNIGNTGFLKGTIARLGQALPPINQAINLVYFGKDIEITDWTKGSFVVFPIFTEGALLKPEKGDNGLYYCDYPDTFTKEGTTYTARVFCPITQFPFQDPSPEERSADSGPIQLRDNNHNFLGYVQLEVNDIVDWSFDNGADPNPENIKPDTNKKKPIIKSFTNDGSAFNRTPNIPPNLQIRLKAAASNPSNDTTKNEDIDIAGHIVLMQRSDTLGTDPKYLPNSWRYLNWAKVSSFSYLASDPAPTQTLFTKNYLIPTFIPEVTDDNEPAKNQVLEISNEKLSLVAGHETYRDEDTDGQDEKEHRRFLRYQFDEKHVGYALWYGYHYKFTGFVALNSGILPTELRADEKAWNVPTPTPELSANLPLVGEGPYFSTYQHLRRVPISKVRVETLKASSKVPPTLPVGLLPLSFELPEWKGNGNTPGMAADNSLNTIKRDQVLFVVGKGSNYEWDTIDLAIKKPTTSFWNWFAWMGKEAKDGGNDSLAQRALVKELDNREKSTQRQLNSDETVNTLCDPAVEDTLVIKIDTLFPEKQEEKVFEISYPAGAEPALDDPFTQLTITTTGEVTTIKLAGEVKSISVKEGEIIRIKIYSKVRKDFFCYAPEEGNKSEKSGPKSKFHYWLSEGLSDYDDTYYLSEPVELWVEAALSIDSLQKASIHAGKPTLEQVLWNSLMIDSDGDNVFALLTKDANNYSQLAYLSRLEVKHQVWNWNGRLDESDTLQKPDAIGLELDPDPKDPKTTKAMEWEAWAFSDRPDSSALVSETNLLATRLPDQPVSQIVLNDHRPGEEKALYYRIMVTAYSRYEKFYKPFDTSVDTSVDSALVVDKGPIPIVTKWRRYLRKCTKTKRLPKPSIRFVLPLTKSIQESPEEESIRSASMLIVLNDHWFGEAGLAEQLEVGVDILSSTSADGQKDFLNAGNDPILTGIGLSPLGQLSPANKTGEVSYPYVEGVKPVQQIAVFKPDGPTGLTFDLKAQTPRLRGCTFVLTVPDVSPLLIPADNDQQLSQRLKAWSFLQIAVRRAIRPAFYQGQPNNPAIRMLNSEWTAKEWVQFLPATDAFIPISWRREVALNGFVALENDSTNSLKLPDGTKIPTFDDGFEENLERYIILTEKVYDIGGQPCESYVATYEHKSDDPTPNLLKLNHPEKKPGETALTVKEGYVRLMIVRTHPSTSPFSPDKPPSTDTVWDKLFGENAQNRPDLKSIQNDPTAALPLVSERIPYRILNKSTK